MDLKLLYVRHSRLMDESDKFVAKEVESLDSVHERLTTLVNIMDRNNVRPIPVAINTKFLNCLQQEWSKYVTMHMGKEKLAKNHDLCFISSFKCFLHPHSHTNSSYSLQSYYVTHPPSVVDYDDEYQGELQGNSQADKLTTAMMLLARAISQKFSTPTNNRLPVSSNIRNQAVVQDGRVDIQTKNASYDGNANKNAGRNRTQGFNAGDESNQIIQRVPRTESTPGKANVQCYNCNEKGHYAHECQKPKVCDAKYFREQMLLAMKDGAGSNLSNEENDFMLDTSNGEELEELTAAAMLMARLQPTDENAETVPSYDAKAVSQFVENNGGASEHDLTAHDEYHEIQMLAYNVQREAENQKRLNNELKKQKDLLQRELETFKDRVKTFESKTIPYSTYKETCDELERELRNDKDTIDRLKTLEDADEVESNEHKMVQIDYEKLNALYETFVPQQEPSAEQTYFSNPSTSDNGSTSKDVPSESPGDPAYVVDCLGYNLFLVGQFCDGDLEVAFRSNTCYVRNLEGDDLLTGSRDSNLYTISIFEMAASSPMCLMSRSTSTKSWLWHHRLSHLNFGTINQLTSHDLVDGLLKFKYRKNHLCSACEQGKSKKDSLSPKLVPSTKSKLELLHMVLCGPMRVARINGKKYILVIVDDYSRYTWVYFLRTKDEAPDMIIDFVNQVQRNLKASILTIQTDNGTEFKNEKLRRNQTLVEAARKCRRYLDLDVHKESELKVAF
ncbi:retrovirus-related pol polyprotein from transposon TNT 1-94 [Tanacetum coccineum]